MIPAIFVPSLRVLDDNYYTTVRNLSVHVLFVGFRADP